MNKRINLSTVRMSVQFDSKTQEGNYVLARTCFNEFLSLLDVAWINKVLLLLLGIVVLQTLAA